MNTVHLAESGKSGAKRSLSVDQVVYLDIIRALGAELVLIGHGFLYFFNYVDTFVSLGSLGVVIFFLISGFLISRSVFTNLRRGGYTFWDYLIERFARIYTAFVPALALIALIDYFLIYHPAFTDTENYTLWNAAGNLLMLQDFPIFQILHHLGCANCWSIKEFSSAHTFWTLPIEWWIYVTFGLLFFSLKNRSWTALRWIILVLVSLYPIYHFIGRYAGSLTGVWMMGLGSSVLYYWAESKQIYRSEDRRWILLTALTLTVLVIPMSLARLVYTNRNVFDMSFTVLLSVMIFAPLFVLKLHPIRVPKAIRLSAHHLASYSYSLYLIHTTLMIAVRTLHREWISGPVDLILMLVGINVAALGFAHLFELRYHAVAERLKRLAALFNWGRFMRTYFPRSICVAFACAGTFVAGTRADLVPQSATSFQVLNPTASQGTRGGQAYRQDDGASSSGHAPIIPVSAESGHGEPTPYPKSERDWPGVGVIRVFGWMTQNRQYFWSQRPVNQGAVVFVGDSLIAGWITLRDDFAPLHVANVGIGGDVSRGVLFRLQEDVIAVNPMAVVILIGTNDMSASEDRSLLEANLTSILKALRDYNPLLPIVLCKLPPRNNPAFPVSTRDMLALNSHLDDLSESDTKLAVLDLYQLLALPDGSVDPQNFEADKLHISPTGYKKFHDALIPILRMLRVEPPPGVP